ncbi:hypothetical protein CON07_14190 [Bacillus sp. AFS094611]|nr:hypothetical protein CON07_14190 [Bacillus sp. AFS094611]
MWKYLKIKKKYKICINKSGACIILMMCAFFIKKCKCLKGEDNSKKFFCGKYKKSYSWMVLYKNVTFFIFSIAKSNIYFYNRKGVILYWKNKSK